MANEAVARGVHALSGVDGDARTGICAHCGPVKLKSAGWAHGKRKWRCRVAFNQGASAGPPPPRLAAWRGWRAEHYESLVLAQNGRCAICCEALDLASPRQVHLDHCHVTGKVRGLLCVWCNLGIGYLREDPKRLQQAMEYLAAHS